MRIKSLIAVLLIAEAVIIASPARVEATNIDSNQALVSLLQQLIVLLEKQVQILQQLLAQQTLSNGQSVAQQQPKNTILPTSTTQIYPTQNNPILWPICSSDSHGRYCQCSGGSIWRPTDRTPPCGGGD